ncbi:MAG: MotA/TolQ/ExbB proton channel family protein, partial [Alphaproteobacteria bacterium]|nr:MotA/TolQ/ExbB proton channel family protein [Alphaproteobacteria bacterium]
MGDWEMPFADSLAVTDALSPFGLFLQADLVVKAVMLVLLVASVVSWAIIFDKWRRIRRLNRDAGRFEELFWSVASLEDLHEQTRHQDRDPMSCVFGEAMLELQGAFESGKLRDVAAREALQARVERVMTVEAGRWMDRIERHMIFLASVGSVSPFIGLFGTVWGIMNSFAAIAASKQTNLAVVAPGIAEALFATALGLV